MNDIESQLEENVDRGAALLDKKVPGWEEKVNKAIFAGNFDMQAWDSCIAGTLELVEFNLGEVRICLNGDSLVGEEQAVAHGFDVPEDEDGDPDYGDYDILDRLWREKVDQRLKEKAKA